MNDIKILKEEIVVGRNFSIYGDAENPLFLAKDIASMLELTNVTDMISRVDESEIW